MFLGLDVGASYAKLVVIDANNKIMHSGRELMPLLNIDNNIAECNINKIIQTVHGLISSIDESIKNNIKRIAVTGQMHGILLVDEKNVPLTNFISWQDNRSTEPLNNNGTYLSFLKKNLLKYRGVTGTEIRPGMMGSILFWLRRNYSQIFNSKKVKATFLSDYIVSLLTGTRPVCDPTNAAGSGIYNIKSNKWIEDYFSLTGIPEDVLPDVVKSNAIVGEVNSKATHFLGIKEGVSVVSSFGDYQTAIHASEIDKKSIAINIGTGSQVSFLIDKFEESKKYEIRPHVNNLYTKCFSGLPGGRYIELFESFVNNVYQINRSTEHDFKVEGLRLTLVDSLVDNYYNAYQKLLTTREKLKVNSIILSGGVGRKSSLVQQAIKNKFNLKVVLPKSVNDAAYGVALLSKNA